MTDIRFQVLDGIPKVHANAAEQNCSIVHTSRPPVLLGLAFDACWPVASAIGTHWRRLTFLVPVVAYCIWTKQTRAEILLACVARDRLLPDQAKTEAAAFLADQRSPMVPMVLECLCTPVLVVEEFGAPAALSFAFYTAPTMQRRLLPTLLELGHVVLREHLDAIVLKTRVAGVAACVSGMIPQTATVLADR